MRKFNTGDIFLVCDQGFDFDWKEEKDKWSSVIHVNSFFLKTF